MSGPTNRTGCGSRKRFPLNSLSATASTGVNPLADLNRTQAQSHAIPALLWLGIEPRLLEVCGLPSAVRDTA